MTHHQFHPQKYLTIQQVFAATILWGISLGFLGQGCRQVNERDAQLQTNQEELQLAHEAIRELTGQVDILSVENERLLELKACKCVEPLPNPEGDPGEPEEIETPPEVSTPKPIAKPVAPCKPVRR